MCVSVLYILRLYFALRLLEEARESTWQNFPPISLHSNPSMAPKSDSAEGEHSHRSFELLLTWIPIYKFDFSFGFMMSSMLHILQSYFVSIISSDRAQLRKRGTCFIAVLHDLSVYPLSVCKFFCFLAILQACVVSFSLFCAYCSEDCKFFTLCSTYTILLFSCNPNLYIEELTIFIDWVLANTHYLELMLFSQFHYEAICFCGHPFRCLLCFQFHYETHAWFLSFSIL